MFKILFMSRDERAKHEYLRGYVFGRNHTKSRPENIIFAYNFAVDMGPFDYGWDHGVSDGIIRYY